jgi:hypothetical protein
VTARNAAQNVLSYKPPANPGPTVDCASIGSRLTSRQLANAEIIFAAARVGGLSTDQAVQMVSASCQESSLIETEVNTIGASGLFQLYYVGYQQQANALGGVLDAVANTETILPAYVKTWKADPTAPPGEVAATVEDSGSPASWYAAPINWLVGYFAG